MQWIYVGGHTECPTRAQHLNPNSSLEKDCVIENARASSEGGLLSDRFSMPECEDESGRSKRPKQGR